MPSKILDLAREVLTIEAEGLTSLIAKLDASFVQAVDLIYRAKGRVIVTGVGKSGIIARKIASNGSHAIRKAKEIIRKGREIPFQEGSKMEAEAFSSLFDYPSTKEGMMAFLEKRKPNW